MGIGLMVEVLDYLPDDVTAAERLVLVALSEKARDDTREVIWRRGENPRATLRQRTGLTDSGLKKAMARLGARDPSLDPRVPLTTDKRGKPVFAFEGKSAQYRIPVLRADLLGNPLEDESRPHRDASEVTPQGLTGVPVGSPSTVESRPHGVGHVPPSLMSPAAREAAALLLARYPSTIAAAEAEAIAGRLDTDSSIRDVVRFVQSPKVSLDDLRRRAPIAKTSDFEKCEHGQRKRVIGAGANASWMCGQCESENPYVRETAAVAS